MRGPSRNPKPPDVHATTPAGAPPRGPRREQGCAVRQRLFPSVCSFLAELQRAAAVGNSLGRHAPGAPPWGFHHIDHTTWAEGHTAPPVGIFGDSGDHTLNSTATISAATANRHGFAATPFSALPRQHRSTTSTNLRSPPEPQHTLPTAGVPAGFLPMSMQPARIFLSETVCR